jgi:hypothetical protein
MDHVVVTYLAYVALAVPLTLWVGRTLHRNGEVFLLDVFDGDEQLAQAVNHLLVVGFYLVNLGYVFLALKVSGEVTSAQTAIEALSLKMGAAVLVLGGMHFANLYVLNRLRRRAQVFASSTSRPPVAPDGIWAAPAPAARP